MKMTVTINPEGTSLSVTDSEILSDYENNNTIGELIKFSVAYNCGELVSTSLTFDDVSDANYSTLTSTLTNTANFTSGIHTVELKYEATGITKVETACVFFDFDNEYKCKANDVITSSNAYLYYQFLVDAQQCDSCSCSTMCDGLTILKSKLDDTTDECNTCD